MSSASTVVTTFPGYCPACWLKFKEGDGIYGANTIAVSIVVAMMKLGAINIAFDEKGTLQNV